MQTIEAPDFRGLHKNLNCAFPLTRKMDENLKISSFIYLFFLLLI